MTRYYHLSSSLDELADLAMDRFLRQHGFRKADETRYYIGNGVDEEVYHHGDRWTHRVGQAGSASFAKTSPQERRDSYRGRLHHAFSPWDRSKLPSAPDLRAFGDLMFEAANQNYTGVDRSRDVANGSSDMMAALTVIAHNIGRVKGQTIVSFDEHYLSPLGGVLNKQACVATLLGATLKWEAEVWHDVDVDLKDLVEDAVQKMDFDSEGGGLKDVLSVASAAAKIATLFTGSPIAAGASVGLGILKDLAPDDRPDSHVQLSGSDPDKIIDSIEDKLVAINRWIRAHEGGIQRSLNRASGIVDHNLRDFDLSRPRGLLREDDRDMLVLTPDESPSESQKDELRLERKAVQVVVDGGLREVAGELDRSRHTSDRASSSSVWLRSDGVGIGGEKGPSDAWHDLFVRHRHALSQTATELRQAGQHLLIATEHLFDTDDQVNRDLHRHSKQIHA
jgi:hypothetical protein